MTKKIAIFLPPLQNVSGGYAVLMQLGKHLAKAEHAVSFVIIDNISSCASYNQTLPCNNIPVIAWDEITLGPEYIWIVPEGWINALVLGLKAKAHCVVYMQAWSFGLSALPGQTRWDQLDVDFMYVSDPVHMCLQSITGKDGPTLRPAIDLDKFYAPDLISLEQAIANPIRIAWMPRKNKVFSDLIQNALADRLARLHPQINIQWVRVQHLSHDNVAEVLRTCHIYLATGFPEGCPLPPLEAMASGCMVVGFGGLGGWDYMRQARFITDSPMPYLYEPWFKLRETPFEGNGLYVADADVLGACLALEQACLLLHNGGPRLATLRQNLADTAKSYSLNMQANTLLNIINNFNV